MIKRCDKGAGNIISDYNDYMGASYRHLSEVQKLPNNEETPFYTKFNPIIKLKIKPI